jgi:Zn finger protein HypA/HybF involved in hydrogenase expression
MKMTVETYKGDAYCVKCKEKRDFEGTVKVSDSGRRMAQGICPVCGTKVNRILGKAQ